MTKINNMNLPISSDAFVVSKSQTDNSDIFFDVDEVYQSSRSLPLNIIQWGIWTQKSGLVHSELNKWERRSNLTGVNFSCAVLSVSKWHFVFSSLSTTHE